MKNIISQSQKSLLTKRPTQSISVSPAEKHIHQKLAVSLALCISMLGFTMQPEHRQQAAALPHRLTSSLWPAPLHSSVFYCSRLLLQKNSSMFPSQNAQIELWERNRVHTALSPLAAFLATSRS